MIGRRSHGIFLQIAGDDNTVMKWLEGVWYPRDLAICRALARGHACLSLLLDHGLGAPSSQPSVFRHIYRELNEEADYFSKHPSEAVRLFEVGDIGAWSDFFCTFDGAHTADHSGIAWIVWGRRRGESLNLRPRRGRQLLRLQPSGKQDWAATGVRCYEWTVIADGSWTLPAVHSSSEAELIAAVSLLRFLRGVVRARWLRLDVAQDALPQMIRKGQASTFPPQAYSHVLARHGP